MKYMGTDNGKLTGMCGLNNSKDGLNYFKIPFLHLSKRKILKTSFHLHLSLMAAIKNFGVPQNSKFRLQAYLNLCKPNETASSL